MEYYRANPNRDIPHPEVVDWATEEYLRRVGKVFRDPDRGIRKLHQEGLLIKVGKGVYRFDPDNAEVEILEEFTQAQKNEILERDGYKCIICGLGKVHGAELHVDHIKPKHLGGKATIENGQVLCSQHNFLKKNLHQVEVGKRMFMRLLEAARTDNNMKIIDFCNAVLKAYEDYDIDDHIKFGD